MHNPQSENPEIDWKEVILRLHALTRSIVKRKKWFRSGNTDTFLKGKQIEDYVYEGIKRYLSNPEKYNPEKGKLVEYIAFNIIRSLVSNDSGSPENKTSDEENNLLSESNELDESSTYREAKLPYIEALFDEQMDYDKIMRHIQDEIKGDKFAEPIFLGLSMGLKRREIISEFEISNSNYDNGIRRLNTILKNTANKFNLQNQTP